MFAIHFFNKGKTKTTRTWEKFKNITNSEYIHFEDPKKNYNYIKSLGIDPKEIAKNILAEIKIYGILEKSRIGIHYVEQ